MKIDAEKTGLDHFLAVSGCVVASFSVAQSIGKQQLALFMGGILIATGIIGFILAKVLQNTRAYDWDGWLFGLIGVIMVALTPRVNFMLPEEGFNRGLLAAVAMWIVMLVGSLTAWRDRTLLFLTLPSIAIFGLVGTIDSFRLALPLFSIFLVCSALLYARSHQRTMMTHAEELGVDKTLLRRDVWKWVAGPEWAFAAVGSVILLSIVITPLIRTGLKPVTAIASSRTSEALRRAITQRANQSRPNYDANIGSGPQTLSDREVFKVKVSDDLVRYLAGRALVYYERHGWRQGVTGQTQTPLTRTSAGTFEISDSMIEALPIFENQKTVTTTISENRLPTAILLAPGFVTKVNNIREGNAYIDGEGNAHVRQGFSPETYTVSSLVPTGQPQARNLALHPTSDYLRKTNISARVSTFARNAIAGAESDIERAYALKSAIEETCQYNLSAPAVPQERDAVEFFLYDSQQGYCDLFASSMALLAREVGLPSRYVVGYLINESRADENGFYTVREKHAHAWAEIYFEDYGWVVFDATENAPEIEGSGVGETISPFQAWWATNGSTVVNVAGIAVLVLSALGVYLYFSRKEKGQVHSPEIQELIKLQHSFQKQMEKYLGSPRRFSQTIFEYTSLHQAEFGTLSESANNLARKFEKWMFGKDQVDQSILDELQKDVTEFKTSLSQLSKQAK